jgi:hypothetical protein
MRSMILPIFFSILLFEKTNAFELCNTLRFTPMLLYFEPSGQLIGQFHAYPSSLNIIFNTKFSQDTEKLSSFAESWS